MLPINLESSRFERIAKFAAEHHVSARIVGDGVELELEYQTADCPSLYATRIVHTMRECRIALGY